MGLMNKAKTAVAPRAETEHAVGRAPASPVAGDGGVVFDRRDQVEKCEGVLLSNERLIAVFDDQGAGAGFVGITDRRLIYYNKALTAKAKVIQSIPWRSVSTVGAVDKGRFARGFFGSSELIVTTVGGETFHMVFRTAEKAHSVHQIVAEHIL
jgi:hypothetical protein